MFDPYAPLPERWKLFWHHYLRVTEGGQFQNGWIGYKSADTPQALRSDKRGTISATLPTRLLVLVGDRRAKHGNKQPFACHGLSSSRAAAHIPTFLSKRISSTRSPALKTAMVSSMSSACF